MQRRDGDFNSEQMPGSGRSLIAGRSVTDDHDSPAIV